MSVQRNVPQKKRFKIGDIADVLNVKKFVVRNWEKEFSMDRSGAGIYCEEDLVLFKKIKELMQQKVSVSEAKEILEQYFVAKSITHNQDHVNRDNDNVLAAVESTMENSSVEQEAAIVNQAVSLATHGLHAEQEVVYQENNTIEQQASSTEHDIIPATQLESTTRNTIIDNDCAKSSCEKSMKMKQAIIDVRQKLIELREMLE